MARNKKPLPLLERVTIEAVAAEGKCLFHWQDMVVFVPWCVPGDVCDVQLRRKKHSFAEGEVVRFIEYSKVRATPFCQHFSMGSILSNAPVMWKPMAGTSLAPSICPPLVRLSISSLVR